MKRCIISRDTSVPIGLRWNPSAWLTEWTSFRWKLRLKPTISWKSAKRTRTAFQQPSHTLVQWQPWPKARTSGIGSILEIASSTQSNGAQVSQTTAQEENDACQLNEKPTTAFYSTISNVRTFTTITSISFANRRKSYFELKSFWNVTELLSR